MDDNSKALTKTGYKDRDPQAEGGHEELGPEECTAYRALAARANYMAQDHPAIQYSAKEACRKMARPVMSDLAALKKLGIFQIYFIVHRVAFFKSQSFYPEVAD